MLYRWVWVARVVREDPGPEVYLLQREIPEKMEHPVKFSRYRTGSRLRLFSSFPLPRGVPTAPVWK
jgi:hypothetical protein